MLPFYLMSQSCRTISCRKRATTFCYSQCTCAPCGSHERRCSTSRIEAFLRRSGSAPRVRAGSFRSSLQERWSDTPWTSI